MDIYIYVLYVYIYIIINTYDCMEALTSERMCVLPVLYSDTAFVVTC